MKKNWIFFLFTPLTAFSQVDSTSTKGAEKDSIINYRQVLPSDSLLPPDSGSEILLSSPNYTSQPQVSKFLEFGISPVSYKGDLSQGYEKWTSAISIGLKRNNKKKWNGHFNLMIGTVTGQNINYNFPTSASPNNFFKANFISLNYDLQYNIIKKEHFILFISQGIGLMRFVPKDEDNNDLADKFSTRAKDETFSNISVIFPHYIGFMYLLKNNYGAGFQLGRLTPGTDYIDNISKLSAYKKPDNIFAFRFSVYAPLTFIKQQPQTKQEP